MFTLRRLLYLLLLISLLLGACAPPAARRTPAPTPSVQPTSAPSQPPQPTRAPDATPTLAPTAGPTPTPPPAGEYELLPDTEAPPADLLDVVLARAAAGEMSLENGLIAALKVYAGEAGGLALADSEPAPADEGNRLLGRALDYLDYGTDPGAQSEIRRLLAVIGPSPEAIMRFAVPQLGSAARGPAQKLDQPRAAGDPPECRQLWAAGFPASESAVCFQYSSVGLSAGEGRVFYPAAWWPGDQRLQFALAASQALADSDRVFSRLGALRSIDLVFTLLDDPDGPNVLAMSPTWNKGASVCQVIVYPSSLAKGVAVFQQTVAHEVFHCFQLWNFPAHTAKGYKSANEWWVEGSAEYFSNTVYPTTNDEWKRVNRFDRRSSTLPLTRMSYETTVFFQYMANQLGDAAIIALFKSFPVTTSPQANADSLTALPAVQSLFHNFAEAWADRSIADTGGGYLPTTIYIDPQNQAEINPNLWMVLEAPPLLLQRYLLAFAPKYEYQVTTQFGGAAGLASARPWDRLSGWDELPSDVHMGCDQQVVFIYVLTSAAPGADPRRGELDAAGSEDPDCKPEADTQAAYGQTACDHPYLPLRTGASWTYASNDGTLYLYTVTSVTGDTTTARAQMSVTGPDTLVEHEWLCSAEQGLLRYMVRETTNGLPVTELTLAGAGGVRLPAPGLLATGFEWDSEVQLNAVVTDPTGGSAPGGMLFEDHYVLVGPADTMVQSRTLAGLKITRSGQRTVWFTFEGHTSLPIVRQSSETLVYAQGVGLVESGTGRLLTYSIP